MTGALVEELLRCPACGGGARCRDGVVACWSCTSTVSFDDGIVRISEPDSFYDAYADIHCPFAPTPKGLKGAILKVLPFWSWREWQFWRAVLPDGGPLLDIGSGRGKEIFIEKADVTVGIDACLTFLKECRRHYDLSVLCSDPGLPFQDGVFDAVVFSRAGSPLISSRLTARTP